VSLAFLRRTWRRRQFVEARIDRAYPAWARRDRPDRASWDARLQGLRASFTISVVMPVHDPRPDWLAAAIASVRAQYFANWELLIADDASQSPAVAALLQRAAEDGRVHVVRLPAQGGIAAATNAGLARASGDYATFLDHDDVLAPHALAAVACEIGASSGVDLVFSDEDQLVQGRRVAPYFKPGWNPDLLLSQNCVSHLAVYRRGLLADIGFLRAGYDGSQDHDLALRAVADLDPRRVRHVAAVLYRWRQSPGSVSAASAAACRDAAIRAVQDHLRGRAVVSADPALPWPRVRFRLPNAMPKVAVVGRLPPTTYASNRLTAVATAEWADSDVLVFLASSLRPLNADWLEELVAQASRPEIGVAGARLLGPDGRLLHAGYTLHPEKIAVSPAADADDPGYRGHFRLLRSVAAVSADCVAVRRLVFEAAGGFSTAAGDFRAVDLCLKLAARGLRTVWTPYAELQYSAAPAALRMGAGWMRSRWGAVLAADPYGNPHLHTAKGRVGLSPNWQQ
jgi:glycosyltransferase involved in cell wall biosynthesis